MEIIYWLLFATIIAILPIYFIKQFLITNEIINLIIALFLYCILIKSYIEIFKQKQISSSYTLLQITQILLVVFGSIVIFNEEITSKKIFGIITGLLSVYLLLN
jgi:multidrug transporter EmrE-like cation transporter